MKLKYEGKKKEENLQDVLAENAETSRYGTACTHLGAAVAEK